MDIDPRPFYLDTPLPAERQWCWRKDWLIEHESAFSLFSKFALLNCVTAREIAQALVSRKCGRKTTLAKNPNIDLRDGSLFDINELLAIFRIKPAVAKSIFLYNLLPTAAEKSSDELRWCQLCLGRGYHTPALQMDLTTHCPIHGIALISACPRCNFSIPYRLSSPVLRNPFECPQCGLDFAPAMRYERAHVLHLRKDQLAKIARLHRFYSMQDLAIDRNEELRKVYRTAEERGILLSRTIRTEIACRYTGFISQVMKDALQTLGPSQAELPLQKVQKHHCGHCRAPNWTEEDDDDSSERVRQSVPAFGASVTYTDLLPTYRSVRRYVWRRAVYKHRDCIRSAIKHLWWHMEGSKTAAFCPVAEAFIRWRMFWEGCSIPTGLQAKRQLDLYGVLYWYLTHTDPTPESWSRATRHWSYKHIFVGALLESLEGAWTMAKGHEKSGEIPWVSQEATGALDGFWAIVGDDFVDRPTSLYMNKAHLVRFPDTSLHHKSTHRHQLSKIQH